MAASRLPALPRALLALLALAAGAGPQSPRPVPVKVFVLAGQSNMQGHGVIDADPARNGGRGSLEWLATDAATAGRWGGLQDEDGGWVVRDDVWIWSLGRHGGLTAGYGARPDLVGPELGFGTVMGEHFEEPVLLVKVAWGGKSLAVDFRPPSAGGETGPFYTELVGHVRDTLAGMEELFPALAGRDAELAGFGWHQGWNDRINQEFNDAYEENLAHLVRDLRRDLDAPELPFVVAETGMSGHEEKHPRALSLMRAQAAVAERPEFAGTVAFVGTRDFFRPKEESPSGQAFHWNNNAETYTLIGEGMALALLRLAEERE